MSQGKIKLYTAQRISQDYFKTLKNVKSEFGSKLIGIKLMYNTEELGASYL